MLGGMGVEHSAATTIMYLNFSLSTLLSIQQLVSSIFSFLPLLLAASVVVDTSEEQQQRAVVSHHLFGNRMRGSKRSQSTIGHGG